MQGSFLGPAFSEHEIAAFLQQESIPHVYVGPEALPDRVAELLAEQRVVGWFQGRMEFGPRALGGRSILADPRGREVQRTVNLKIKFRESFRPFAPSVLAERADAYFDLAAESPYMLLVAPVRGASIEGEGLDRLHHIDSPIPAVTHVDGTARVQTVHAETNPLYHRLLQAFEARTGCPVLVNTSFNVRGEPIVCTPSDAYQCFRRTHMDALALGPFLIPKSRFVWRP
jgi:carbamoyltransferase